MTDFSISRLSPDIIRKISSFLSKKNFCSLKSTNKYFNNTLQTPFRLPLTALQQTNVNRILLHLNGPEPIIYLNTGSGTGKTITALFVIDEVIKQNKKCLIITKNPFIWKDELDKINQNSLYKLENVYVYKKINSEDIKLNQNEIAEQLQNKNIIVLPFIKEIMVTFPRVLNIPVYPDLKYIPYNTLINQWDEFKTIIETKKIKYFQTLIQRQKLQDTFLQFKWDLIIFDDINVNAGIEQRCEHFNPQTKILSLTNEFSLKKDAKNNMINNYLFDPEIGNIPSLKTSAYFHDLHSQKANYLSGLFFKIINSNLKNKILIINNCIYLENIIDRLKHKFKNKNIYYLENKNKFEIISSFSKLDYGILIGPSSLLRDGHNIFPQKIYIFNDLNNPLSYLIINKLVNRIKRSGSPYQECILEKHELVINKNIILPLATVFKSLSKKQTKYFLSLGVNTDFFYKIYICHERAFLSYLNKQKNKKDTKVKYINYNNLISSELKNNLIIEDIYNYLFKNISKTEIELENIIYRILKFLNVNMNENKNGIAWKDIERKILKIKVENKGKLLKYDLENLKTKTKSELKTICYREQIKRISQKNKQELIKIIIEKTNEY